MNRRLFPLLIFTAAAAFTLAHSSVSAEIYKEVDKDGNIVYTDVPGKGKQKPISVKPMSTYKPGPSTTRSTSSSENATKPAKKTTTTYSTLQISSPEAGAVIRANSGVVSISLQSQPGLDVKAGHRFVILIDGQQSQESTSASVSISNVDRGSHSVSAEIRDEKGNVMASASPVQFDVLRASILSPGNR